MYPGLYRDALDVTGHPGRTYLCSLGCNGGDMSGANSILNNVLRTVIAYLILVVCLNTSNSP
jgi:hypothetical protein